MTANTNNSPIAVLGAGAWGSALAILLARNGQSVRLWSNDPKQISEIYHKHTNQRYLPGITFPDNVQFYAELDKALSGVQDILIAVPSVGFRNTLQQIKKIATNNVRIISGTKGLDPETGKLLHEVVQEIFGNIPIAILSGPSFAKEVALGLPTAVTLANNDPQFAKDIIQRFHNAAFRVYTSKDLIGVQVCNSVKNVLAVAVGTSDGLGFGANARCALITRGLAEMARLGMAMGGKLETCMGLAGVGDLVLTTTDDQSRNRRFGVAIGKGKTVQEAREEIGQVVEGADNAVKVYELAQRMKVVMPITEQVYRILYEKLPPLEAMKALLARELKEESI